jgi:hypothetical protein
LVPRISASRKPSRICSRRMPVGWSAIPVSSPRPSSRS